MLKELLILFVLALLIVCGILYVTGYFNPPAAPKGNESGDTGGTAWEDQQNRTPGEPPTEIKLAVIGSLDGSGATDPAKVSAPLLKKWLDDNGKKEVISYSVVQPADFAGVIKDYDVLLIAGERQITEPLLSQINDYALQGGRVIVIGDAAVELPNVTYIGWKRVSGAGVEYANHTLMFMPVEKNTDRAFELMDAKLRILLKTHEAVTSSGISEESGLECGTAYAYDISPEGGRTVTLLNGTYQGRPQTAIAFVESTDEKIQYYAYDPGCTPDFWLYGLRSLAD
jgi:hypothetical protein